jgi:hypothetical protein
MATPLLFGKRCPLPPVTALQYVGTDTELDVKTPSSKSASE